MTLTIDTTTIRRLRDALLAGSEAAAEQAADAAGKTNDRLQASIERAAPFVETMYLVMIADGQVQPAEKAAILGALSLLTHGYLDLQALERILEDSEAEVARHGVIARLQKIGSRVSARRQDREIAFTLAAAVALADNNVASQEHSLLESIAEWYGISEMRCRELLEQF